MKTVLRLPQHSYVCALFILGGDFVWGWIIYRANESFLAARSRRYGKISRGNGDKLRKQVQTTKFKDRRRASSFPNPASSCGLLKSFFIFIFVVAAKISKQHWRQSWKLKAFEYVSASKFITRICTLLLVLDVGMEPCFIIIRCSVHLPPTLTSSLNNNINHHIVIM